MAVTEAGKKWPRTRRAEVIETAARIFYEKGYEAATMQDIADALGVLKGSVYYYISTKQEVLFEIVKSYHDETRGYFDEIVTSTAPVEERLRRFIETETAHSARNRVRSSLFYTDWRSLTRAHQKEIIKERDRHDEFVRDCLTEGQEKGTISPDVDVTVASLGILGMMNSVYRWYRPRGRSSAEEIGRAFADLILSGLLTRPDP